MEERELLVVVERFQEKGATSLYRATFADFGMFDNKPPVYGKFIFDIDQIGFTDFVNRVRSVYRRLLRANCKFHFFYNDHKPRGFDRDMQWALHYTINHSKEEFEPPPDWFD